MEKSKLYLFNSAVIPGEKSHGLGVSLRTAKKKNTKKNGVFPTILGKGAQNSVFPTILGKGAQNGVFPTILGLGAPPLRRSRFRRKLLLLLS